MRTLVPLAGLVLACSAAPAASDGPAHVSSDAWTTADAALDPFPAHRPDEVTCGIDGWYDEAGALEVDTGRCPYLLVTQPSQVDVRAGQAIRLYLYHDALVAPEPAQGHVALSLDGEVIWELTVDIPHAAAPYDVTVEAPSDVPAGAPAVLHLHNHGSNTWTLLDVDVLP